MATLYVENIPEDLYDSLRERARRHRKSIAAEILSLLEQNVVTPAELKSRELFLRQVKRLRSRAPRTAGTFASSEEMQREDRTR
jgi:plasmid stability protein